MSEQQQAPDEPRRAPILTVAVGHEDLEHGRVHAELYDDGTLLVTKAYAGERQRFSGRIDPEVAEEAHRRADDLARVSRERSGHTPVPDEALYRIELRGSGDEPLLVEVWQNELDDRDDARRLVRALRDAVARVSDGQALL